MGITTYSLLNEVLEHIDVDKLLDILYVHKGTFNRWLQKKEVPNSYFNDLNSIIEYKYTSLETYKDKDQYYTTNYIANYCYNKTLEVLKELDININIYNFIEPSAGNGSFYSLLPKNKKVGIDIDPKGEFKNEILKSNYLNFIPKKNNNIVIGNPPFGLRGNLALRFINHSYNFADIVAFILPPLFDSTGKGVAGTRVKGYELAHTEKLPLNSFEYPDGKSVDIATIFQVWTKVKIENIKLKPRKTCKKIIKVYSLSNGGKPSNTRNKNMLDKCDIYLPSTCFNEMKAYKSFDDLPNKRGYGIVFLQKKEELFDYMMYNVDWYDIAFKSTNSALNLRTDLIENVVIKKGYFDE